MICEKGKLMCFKEESEMANGGISNEEFTIKGGILGFGGGSFLGKESKGSPGPVEPLLKDCSHVGDRGIGG